MSARQARISGSKNTMFTLVAVSKLGISYKPWTYCTVGLFAAVRAAGWAVRSRRCVLALPPRLVAPNAAVLAATLPGRARACASARRPGPPDLVRR